MLERLYSRQKAPASRERRLYRKSRAADIPRDEMIRARVCVCLSVHEYTNARRLSYPHYSCKHRLVCVCVCVRARARGAWCVRACVRASL
jgi:hypothetical protein